MLSPKAGRRDGHECGGADREADCGPAQDAIDDRAPYPAFRVRPLHRPPADDRQTDGVHAVLQQPEQGRQQRERYSERGDADDDRSAARLRKIVEGTISRPNIAITNADPLNSTARLAVPPVVTIASSGERLRPRSSR